MVKALLPAWIFHFAAKKDDEPKPVPDDLSTLSDEDLASLEDSLVERAQPLADDENIDADGVAALTALADDLDRVRAEKTTRQAQAEELKGKREEAAARISGADPNAEGTPPARAEAPPTVPAEPAAAVVEGETATVEGEPAPELVSVTLANGDTYEVPATVFPADVQVAAAGPRKLNGTSLSEIRRRAPQVLAKNRPDRVLVAAADIPGYTSGGELADLGQVADAMQRRARAMGDSRGGLTQVPIASIEKSHGDLELDVTSELTEVEWDLIQRVADPEVLAAAGGWCAPSEIRYELFDVTCEDGMIDLPTVGITRGGIRWPVSLSVADVLGAVWTWTEANDLAADAVSGGPTKPCAHVECVSFSEARLAYEGLCVTAGNLTERSYPELIRDFISKVMSAHFHRINKSKIDQMVTLAGTVIDVGSPATGAAANVLAAIDLQAIDYRAKFGMCLDAILEVVLPDWIEGPIRADFSRRMGLDPGQAQITDAVMNRWFDERQVRVQFVNDYQIRASGFPGNGTIASPSALLSWPATVNFLIYAAGTFLLGDGPTIDLGVIRDSTLNARNDYTAAWSEEGFLIAEVGHEARNVEVEIEPDGTTGAQASITGAIA